MSAAQASRARSALVVTGGAFDVPPEAYGETARDGMGPTKPSRTAFETVLMVSFYSIFLLFYLLCGIVAALIAGAATRHG